jgi:ABC-type glutathione transport system ATPase component
MTAALLDVRGLVVEFAGRRRRPPVRALDGVDLRIAAGETLAVVGESGSGKSTLANAILGLVPVSGGRIGFAGEDITHAGRSRRRLLSASLQCVFQDPYGSLNPSRTIGQTLAEPLLVHERLSRGETRMRVAQAVGCPPGSPAASASGSPSPARSCSRLAWSSATSRSARSTSPSRHRCSTSSASCRRSRD